MLEDLITDCDPIARNCPENADCEPVLFEKLEKQRIAQLGRFLLQSKITYCGLLNLSVVQLTVIAYFGCCHSFSQCTLLPLDLSQKAENAVMLVCIC